MNKVSEKKCKEYFREYSIKSSKIALNRFYVLLYVRVSFEKLRGRREKMSIF
jgi:hypothetical protein